MKQLKDSFFLHESGFSLVELIVYLVILGILMTAIFASFTSTMRRSAQQTSIAETKIETNVGLELLRADLEHAGFGLPWQLPAVPSPYSEPSNSPFNPGADTLLTPLMDAPNVPKAIISQDNSPASLNDSDYLVIRAINVTLGVSSQKWGYVGRNTANSTVVQSMSKEAFVGGDKVIVLRPEFNPGEYRQLVMNGTSYITQIIAGPPLSLADPFAPIATPNDPDGEKYLVYGLNEAAVSSSRPFNRTDYYINDTNVPTHCAPNTGVLTKATAHQEDDEFLILPVMDCVADFQIVYYLDTNNDGGWDQRANADGLAGLTPVQIRGQVKAVRLFILTHEGGIDRSFSYPQATVNVGEADAAGAPLVPAVGRSFDLAADIGGNWANYRWKIESMAVTPKNLK